MLSLTHSNMLRQALRLALIVFTLAASAALVRSQDAEGDAPDEGEQALPAKAETFLDDPTPNDQPPRVPAQVLLDFVQAVTRTAHYQIASNMHPDDVRAAVAPVSEEIGWPIEVRESRYIEYVVEELGLNEDETGFGIYLEEFETQDYYKELLVIEDYRSEPSKQYRVDFSQLEGIDVSFVSEVNIRHPLNLEKAVYRVANHPLNQLVDDLCTEGDVDYAIRSDMASDITLNVALRNRSPLECLNFAAHAAGWRVRLMRGDTAIERMGSVSIDTLWEIGEAYVNRDMINYRLGEDSPWRIETPIDALSYIVRNDVRSMFERRYTVVVEPNEPVNHDAEE